MNAIISNINLIFTKLKGRKMKIKLLIIGVALLGVALSVFLLKAFEKISAEDAFEKGNEFLNQENYAEAVKWYRKAAEQGLALAQYNLGVSYANGLGVSQNYTEAVKWYRKAAEQGYAAAQYNLGRCYANGQGVPQSFTEAEKWYRKAAEQGFILHLLKTIWGGAMKKDKACHKTMLKP